MTEYGRNCQQIISTNVENYQELFFLSDLFVMLTKKRYTDKRRNDKRRKRQTSERQTSENLNLRTTNVGII